MQTQGHTFLITGGSSGLGAGCAQHLVPLGAQVVIADVNAKLGEALVDQLGPAAHFILTDVTNSEHVRQAIETAVSHFGSLSGVINCAGILGAGRVVGRDGPYDLEAFSRVVQVNLVGTFNVVRLAAVEMADNAPEEGGERGVIINTASVAAYEGQIGQAAYSASKGGIVGMTLPIARELARFGIRVVAIAPGVFDTPMTSALSQEARAALADQVPYPHRLGRPAEFAAMAVQIIENPMLNGSVVRLDGALRMSAK